MFLDLTFSAINPSLTEHCTACLFPVGVCGREIEVVVKSCKHFFVGVYSCKWRFIKGRSLSCKIVVVQ